MYYSFLIHSSADGHLGCFHILAIVSSQHHLLKRVSLPHYLFLPPLSKISYPQVHGFISGLSILFHCSIFLFLCQYHTVLITVALQFSLKSGRLIPPAPFFFLKTVLDIQGLLCLHMNCEFFCSSSVKSAIGNLIGIALNLLMALSSIVISKQTEFYLYLFQFLQNTLTNSEADSNPVGSRMSEASRALVPWLQSQSSEQCNIGFEHFF